MGLNQTEKPATTEKIKRLKPRNTVELTAFVAAIRPGGKSLIDDFINRRFHNYGIPAMDKLLKMNGATGVTGESSFLFFDEDILTLAQSAGIPAGDAVTLIKAIKKKKHDKVKAYKDQFIPGFIKYLIEKENVDEEIAKKTSEDVWTVIMNSASYLFCRSHALAMNYDCMYGAMLKTIAPYEFYTTLFKLYTEKSQIDKIVATINEMSKYKSIKFIAGKFGQDNRDWYSDKEAKTISQSLSSIKFISKGVADALYEAGKQSYDSFTDLLRYLQMNTSIDTRQIKILILINYFSSFGKTGKLMKIYKEFFEGENKVTKTIKSYEKRLNAIREFEKNCVNVEEDIYDRVVTENDNVGICLSKDESKIGYYLVEEIDDRYGIKVKLYGLASGKSSPILKVKKDTFYQNILKVNDCIKISKENIVKRQKYSYKNGTKTAIKGEYDIWLENYKVLKHKEDE